MTNLPARFWAKVRITPDHWIWTGAVDGHGYGIFNTQRTDGSWYTMRAFHLTAAEAGLDVPPGQIRDHWCQEPSCVNPAHIRLATVPQNAENRADTYASSGVRNVYRRGKRWRVQVQSMGVDYQGGTYDTIAEADLAARALRDKLFTHHMDGLPRKLESRPGV